MKCFLSVCICASFLLSGCMTGRNLLSERPNPEISKTTRKASLVGTRSGQGSIPQVTVSEGSRDVSPVSASFSDTTEWDRFEIQRRIWRKKRNTKAPCEQGSS